MKDAMRCMLALLLVGAIALGAVCAYSRQQMHALSAQRTYATPEEGTRAVAAAHYVGPQDAEIIHASHEPCALGNLHFVEARVWAQSRSDGKPMTQKGDNPGWSFLRRDDGWVFVAEEHWPWFIALGQRVLGS